MGNRLLLMSIGKLKCKSCLIFIICFLVILSFSISCYSGEGNDQNDYFSSLVLRQPLTEIKSGLQYNGAGYIIPATAVYGSEGDKKVISLIESDGVIFFKSTDIKIVKKIDSNIVAASLSVGDRILSDRNATINYLQRVMPETLKKRFAKPEPTILRTMPPGY